MNGLLQDHQKTMAYSSCFKINKFKKALTVKAKTKPFRYKQPIVNAMSLLCMALFFCFNRFIKLKLLYAKNRPFVHLS
jgi:hypothetical protein